MRRPLPYNRLSPYKTWMQPHRGGNWPLRLKASPCSHFHHPSSGGFWSKGTKGNIPTYLHHSSIWSRSKCFMLNISLRTGSSLPHFVDILFRRFQYIAVSNMAVCCSARKAIVGSCGQTAPCHICTCHQMRDLSATGLLLQSLLLHYLSYMQNSNTVKECCTMDARPANVRLSRSTVTDIVPLDVEQGSRCLVC